jgi:hypothetical protein
MTSEAFNQWLADMKAAEIAPNDKECAALLGVTQNSILNLKRKGADIRTALACRALLHRLPPYDGTPL